MVSAQERGRRARLPRVQRGPRSSLPPWTSASVAVSATFPRQASWPKAFWVACGRRLSFAAMRSDDVVGEALGADARQVPRQTWRIGFEDQQRLFGQRAEELDREERIAGRSFRTPAPPRVPRAPGAVCSASASNRATSVGQKGRQQDLLQSRRRRAASRIVLSIRASGCDGVDLVVAVGADQQQVRAPRVR